MQLRKIVKTRGNYPTEEAATTLLYLALRNIAAKWQRRNHDWKAAMPYLSMPFGSRFTGHSRSPHRPHTHSNPHRPYLEILHG